MKTIRTKLLLIMFVAALVIIFVLDFVAIKAISKTTKDTLMSSAKPLAIQGANNFNGSVQEYVNDMYQACSSTAFTYAEDEEQMVEVLAGQFPDELQGKISYSIIGSAGQMMYSTNNDDFSKKG